MTMELIWRTLAIRPTELLLSKVLRCGQTFRWKNIDNVWAFAISDRIVLLEQSDKNIQYSWIMADWYDGAKTAQQLEAETSDFIHDYFALSIKLEELYSGWLEVDGKFQKSLHNSPFVRFTGIRMLRQEPWECSVSFICSSNNNVKRISKMCDNLCNSFGTYIAEYKGIKFHCFPTPQSLAQPGTEQTLRDLGFGYRARYIHNTALKFVDNESFPEITQEKLTLMREESYEDAHEYLLQLDGVGPKVADCICLMALDKHDIVPVDTHVYQIAMRDFKYKGKRDLKTLNKQMYHDIRQFFKKLFGPYAGWAQSVLFASDLSDLNNGVNEVTQVKTEVKTEVTKVLKEKSSNVPSKRTIKKEVTTIKTKRVKIES